MPTFEDHNLNYSTNLAVADGMLKSSNPPNDWIITIYFYAALHLIEKTLSNHGLHSGNHKERFSNVRSHLGCIAIPYQSLYNESKQARYDCVEMTSGKVERAKRNLDKIAEELG